MKTFLAYFLMSTAAYAGCPNHSGTYVYEEATCYKLTIAQKDCASADWELTDGTDTVKGTFKFDGIFRSYADTATAADEFRDKTHVSKTVWLNTDKLESIISADSLDKKGNIAVVQQDFDSTGMLTKTTNYRWLKLNTFEAAGTCASGRLSAKFPLPFIVR